MLWNIWELGWATSPVPVLYFLLVRINYTKWWVYCNIFKHVWSGHWYIHFLYYLRLSPSLTWFSVNWLPMHCHTIPRTCHCGELIWQFLGWQRTQLRWQKKKAFLVQLFLKNWNTKHRVEVTIALLWKSTMNTHLRNEKVQVGESMLASTA